MTPTKTECSAQTYSFGQLDRRQVVADFSGGQITSDGGLILVAQIDQHYRISERLAACFEDQRAPGRVQHELKDLVSQRLYGLVQGYEDLNDPSGSPVAYGGKPSYSAGLTMSSCGMILCLGSRWAALESEHPRCAPPSGKSTLNRLEQAMHVEGDLSEQRYIKFRVKPSEMESLLVELFIEQQDKEPKQIILDMDVSDDPVHGTQERMARSLRLKQL